MSMTANTRGNDKMLKLAGILMFGVFGYAGGYYLSTNQESALVVDETVSAVGEVPQRSTTSTTTLPGKRVNAFEMQNPLLPGIDGQKHSLEEWRGRVIMLNFWATWCPACQYEIPDFIRFQKDYADRDLQIVGIGIDEMRKLKNFDRTMEVNYPILASAPEKSESLLQEWGNREQMLPYTVIIDRDGRITYIHRGQFNQDAFDEFVLPLLVKEADS